MKQPARTTFLYLVSMLAACGPADSNDKSNNSTNDNGRPGQITEILPDGYDRVAAGRFSPDGSRLAMVATAPGGEEHLITTDLTGGDIEVLVSEGLSYLTTVAWLPNGESIVYGGDGIMQVGSDASTTMLVDVFAAESVDVSPDGAWVTWSINGGTTITTAPVSADPAATDEHIPGPEGGMPRFSPNGERIAYIASDGVAVSTPRGDDVESIEASVDYLSNVAWRDDDTVVALTDFGVTSFDLASEESTDIHEEFAATGLDVSPDGSMFVLGVNGQESLRLGSF